jgi:diguanylate cyclase
MTKAYYFWIVFCVLFFSASATAQQQLSGQWYEVAANWHYAEPLNKKILKPTLTGGHFVFKSTLDISDTQQPIVIDFKNSSTIAKFHHYIVDQQGRVVAETQGGIALPIENTFFMRHGREFKLATGQYQLTTILESPYFIAVPEPYWDTLSHYRQAIKWGTLIGLVSLGVLISLCVYYAILACVRKRMTEAMYTGFIASNIIFNGTTMLITPDLLHVHWFYLAGATILLSNLAYLFFAKHLLQINKQQHPILTRFADVITVLLGVLLLVALLKHNWLMECARYGVGLMMVFGLVAAITRAYQRYTIAYYYLVAVLAFFVIGSIAIFSSDLAGIYTIYVEHIGLVAVAVEVLLIGLVLGYQFASVYREKETNLALLRQSLQIARYDALTGLPNRYALDEALSTLPAGGMLMLLDIDHLKWYNDTYGHQKGDELLQLFAKILAEKINGYGVLHRMGGDEFAVTIANISNAKLIEDAVSFTVDCMHQQGFENSGVSYGAANMLEAQDISTLNKMADERMYQHKRSTRTENLLNSTN